MCIRDSRQLAPNQDNQLESEPAKETIPYIRALAIASEPKTDKALRQQQEAKEIALQIKLQSNFFCFLLLSEGFICFRLRSDR